MTAERGSGVLRLGAIHTLLELHFWFPIWIVFLLERGISLGTIVVADAYFRLLVILLELPMGMLGDRLGRKQTYLMGALFAVAAYGTLAVTHGVAMLFLCWTLWAFAIALISGTDTAYLYEAITARNGRQEAIAVFGRFRAAGASAFLFSLITAGWLYERAAVLPVLLNAGAALAAAFLLSGTRSLGAGSRHLSWSGALRDLIGHVRARPVARLAIGLLAALTAYYWTVTLLIQPLLHELGFSPAAFGPVFASFSLAGIIGGLVSGRLARVVGDGRLIVCGSVLLVVAVATLAFVPGRFCLAGLPLLGVGFFLAEPVTRVVLNEEVPDHIRAAALSLASLLASVVLMGSRPLVGLVAERFDVREAFIVWAAAGVPFLAYAMRALAVRYGIR